MLLQTALVAGCNGQIGSPEPIGNPRGGGTTPVGTGEGNQTAPPNPKACLPGMQPAIPPARVWRLTHTQYKNTLLNAFDFAGTKVDSFPADGRLAGYANAADALAASTLLTDYYYKASQEVATDVARRGEAVVGCPLTSLSTGTCLDDFLKKVGQKAWRRPVTDDEVAKLKKLYSDVAGPNGPDAGLKSIVQALIMSSNFIFRTELGNGQNAGDMIELTDYELASALSYTIWDSPPDDALFALASSGQIRQQDTLLAQARRLLAVTDKSAVTLNSFVKQWLGTDTLLEAQKSPTVFPGFDATVSNDLLEETRLFVNSVVFDPGGDKTLKTLLTASYGYVTSKTANLYGLSSAATTPTRVDLPKSERRGLLTQAGFLAANSGAEGTSLVSRGRFVRETFLCAAVDPPPRAFVFDPSVITDDMTGREKFEIHAKNPACAGCHVLFDGIGYAMENYDGIGRFRTTDKGKKLDPSGSVPMLDGSTVSFANFVDMLDKFSVTPSVYDCFSSQYLMYALGKLPKQVDACEVASVAGQFADSGYKLDALTLAIVGSPGFRTRQF